MWRIKRRIWEDDFEKGEIISEIRVVHTTQYVFYYNFHINFNVYKNCGRKFSEVKIFLS